MNFQDYINSLNVGHEVVVKDKNNFHIGVVNKITPTGILRIIPNYNELMVYSFDKYGKPMGNNYSISIVNKFNEAAMRLVKLHQAECDMKFRLSKVIKFLEKQQDSYSSKNNDILTNIQELLKTWQVKSANDE